MQHSTPTCRKGKKPLLEDVKDFTVMLKNSVEFPDCGNQQGRNLPNHMTESKQVDLKTCMYDKLTDPHCPIFRIGDIVKWGGDDFSRVAIKVSAHAVKFKMKLHSMGAQKILIY